MSFFRKKELFILLFGVILLVILVGYSLGDRKELSVPEQFIKDTVGWTQKVVHAPVNFVTNIFSNIDDVRNTYKENKILKEKISTFKGLAYENQKLSEENKELRKLLDTTESIRDFKPIQASVISRSPERWVEQVTINKGAQDGVKKDMAVRTAEGMIGKVQSTSQFSSTVQLLSGFDQFNRISATITRKEGKEIFGLIEGYDEETKMLTFRMIDESASKIKKGELVFSSGLGGKFPAGLPIGKVKEVVPDQYGLTETALVEPAADLHNIDNVIVVNRTLSADDGQDGDESGDES